MTQDWFEIPEIVKLTGLSKNMIDYLCRTKLITPSRMGSRGRGRGKTRRFSFGNVVQLRTYAELLKQGVSVKRLKEAQITWNNYFNSADQQSPPKRFLMTDGERIYFCRSEDVIEELNKKGQFSFRFIVDIQKIKDDIKISKAA
ncbi:MAG: MerR family transcriptional regulator [Rhodospirillaceae bacterium]|nr:MerR family transcriptional regulator [Rhodospirillaceae bacterium]MBT5938387.1 MerR family transcriptional regulator [Rhodospirillaceae bacterium]MBT7957267.1 MerR family transcriptional regulator [Rhodospirillaceae bacterium]